MISLGLLFKNHFSSEKNTNNRLGVFAGDMVGKVSADNIGGRRSLERPIWRSSYFVIPKGI